MPRRSKHKMKQAERAAKLVQARKKKKEASVEGNEPSSSQATCGGMIQGRGVIGTEKGTLSIRDKLLKDHFSDNEVKQCDETSDFKVTISISRLQKLFEMTSGVCTDCFGKMMVDFQAKNADVNITVSCKVCKTFLYKDESECLHDRFPVNTTSFVYNSIHSGSGFTGYKDNSAFLNIKPLSTDGYYAVQKFIGKRILELNDERKDIVKDCVFKHYEKIGKPCDSDGILNVMVSYDGSWMTRGHKSHIGLGCVIEAETGFILDFEVLSNICIQCTKIDNKKKKTDITPEQYQAMKAQHKPHCQQNFSGKAGAMEAEAAVRMWKRSIEKNKMRYTTFIGDGDSSSYKAVTDMRDGKGPYDVPVRKEECVNHVGKRFGTRLRNLKDSEVKEVPVKRAPGKTRKVKVLGGKKKLTDSELESLPFYYGQAVRRHKNSTVDDLRKDILATFYHCTSSDDNPRHDQCPPGEKSWCFFQKALAKKETPPSHENMKVQLTLDPPERSKVFKVYLEMTQTELLLKCMLGKTQNVNESVHSKIWNRLLKTKFYGLRTVMYGVGLTVLEHNFGYERTDILSELGFQSKTVQKKVATRKDITRKRKSLEPSKPRKKRVRKEDDVDYGAGEFREDGAGNSLSTADSKTSQDSEADVGAGVAENPKDPEDFVKKRHSCSHFAEFHGVSAERKLFKSEGSVDEYIISKDWEFDRIKQEPNILNDRCDDEDVFHVNVKEEPFGDPTELVKQEHDI